MDESKKESRGPNPFSNPEAADQRRLHVAPKDQLFDKGWNDANNPELTRQGQVDHGLGEGLVAKV